MSDTTKYIEIVGDSDLWGWAYDWSDARDAVLQRVFGYMVRAAHPVVREFHGDLFVDADSLRETCEAAFTTRPQEPNVDRVSFLYCVRHSGTNMGTFARPMFDSLAYDAALYEFEIRRDPVGRWFLRVDLLGARPDTN